LTNLAERTEPNRMRADEKEGELMDVAAPDGRHRQRSTGPLDGCPACGSERLVAVAAQDETNFLCEECRRCWHVELAHVSRVDPVTCPGCPMEPRCLERRLVDERRQGPVS
jgi:hypothetical protein